MDNPLLSPFATPHELPPFDHIEPEHFLPALKASIEEARKEIDEILNVEATPDFKNTIEALESTGERLQLISSILFNLNAAETTEKIQQTTQEASPLLTAFDNEVKQNEALFARVRQVYEEKDDLQLTPEQHMLLDKTYQSFIRNGAALDDQAKARYKEITTELARLSLKFGENLLKETNDYALVVEDESRLSGIPQDVRQRAAKEAEKRNEPGKWVFTLQAPSYLPIMEYADDRALREEIFKAFMSKAMKGNERDNRDIIRDIVKLRAEKASLLGYNTYAEYVLQERMAASPEKVLAFEHDLLEKALTKAREEVEEIREFMKSLGVQHELQRWDWAYYSEKLRKQKFELDDELTKPYFKLEYVIDGVFKTAEKLYGLSFKENKALPRYHEEVITYEVYDDAGTLKSIFFADFFPREGKRPGAWMTLYRNQKRVGGKRVVPHVSIVCNFTPSSPDHPSLLKFDEVKTLFHEFGHALHGMLADTTYSSLAGTNVYWDFVELPSQVMENWCFEKECLDLFARHYQTGEAIPETYVERLKASSTYHEAYATVRQISFGMLDMAYHHQTLEEARKLEDVVAFENEAFAPTELFPKVSGINMSVQFGHIFAGGYAAGYYSYKWAEVLDADAFSLFEENGVFDQETASRFKEEVLSKGGTRHPMELYKAFRGKEPDPEALLKRAGLA
jgi:peptidyl-dipeptidase Dcp